MVCLQIRSTSSSTLQVLKRSAFLRVLLELVTVLAVLLAPIAMLWVPYRDGLYGFDGTICLIKHFRPNASEPVSSKYLFVYDFGVYEVVGFIALCIALGMIMIYCTLFTRLKRAKYMVKHLVLLISAVVVNLLILNMMVAISYLKNSGFGLRIIFVILATLDDFVFLSGYLLTFYSFKIYTAVRKLFKRKAKKHANDQRGEYGTFRESNRTTVPSNTYYDIQYTGQFTNITSHDS